LLHRARVGGARALIFRGDVVHDLSAKDLDVARRLDAKTNAAPIAGEDDHANSVANEDRVSDFPAEYQHS
jgi:hypothetical protein